MLSAPCPPCLRGRRAQASQAGLSGKQKIKQVLSVLSVSAVKLNIKTAPFEGFIKPSLLGVEFDSGFTGFFFSAQPEVTTIDDRGQQFALVVVTEKENLVSHHVCIRVEITPKR